MYPPQLVPQQLMLRLSRYPHNQAFGGHQPTPLLHPRKLHSPCATQVPVLQLPQCCQHRGVHLVAGFICCEQRHRQSGSPAQRRFQKVTQHTKHMAPSRLLLWGVQSGCGTKSTTQKEKFRTVQAGFQESQAKVHSRLLGFHLGLKPTVPDSSSQTAPAPSLSLT